MYKFSNAGFCRHGLTHLYHPVLGLEPGLIRRWSRVEGADVLSGPRSIAVQVEAVANLRPHQVAHAWSELRRINRGPWMVLGLGLILGTGLLEENKEHGGFWEVEIQITFWIRTGFGMWSLNFQMFYGKCDHWVWRRFAEYGQKSLILRCFVTYFTLIKQLKLLLIRILH